jgi:type IV pilus assembly protein PilY1
MVYVGANDGMLHAFVIGVWDWHSQRWIHNPNDPDVSEYFATNNMSQYIGRELWAYVPSNLLSELSKLAKKTYGLPEGCPHRNTVDLSPNAWRVFIDHDGDNDREWRTVLVGGE